MSARNKARLRANPRRAFPTGASRWLLGLGVVVAVVAVGGWFLLSGGAPQSPGVDLPFYVRTASADVREAYTYALEHPEVLQHIPCYCGCGDHNGHRSNWNCFVQARAGSSVVFDSHGAG